MHSKLLGVFNTNKITIRNRKISLFYNTFLIDVKIITFGSCLSRYTAKHFCQNFGGKVISSVYHNRSDAFLGKFIEKNWIIYPEAEIRRLVNDQCLPILQNQYEKTVGMHHLKNGYQFFEALKKGQGDLIIVDNFIDITARLLYKKFSDKEGLFLRSHDFLNQEHNLILGDYLSVDSSILAIKKIICFISEKLPKAAVVFINFPGNTYSEAHIKAARIKDFEEKFFIDNGLVIPALNIHKLYQTLEKSHFKPAQYSAYAGIIYEYLTSKEIPVSPKKWQYTNYLIDRFRYHRALSNNLDCFLKSGTRLIDHVFKHRIT